MTVLWVLYGVILLLGIGAATAVCVADRRPRPAAARQALDGRRLDAGATALLTGGPARVVDAVLVGMVERGLVVADIGRFHVAPEAAADARGRDDHDLLAAVAASGQGGLDAVRRRAVPSRLHRDLLDLADRGLITTPSGRLWAPARVVGPVLAGMLVCAAAMAVVAPDREVVLPLALFVLVPSAFLPALVWRLRVGHHGPDPRTALGRDVSALLRADLPPGAAQAERVAAGGFAAMTDAALRGAIKGRAADSRWRVPPRMAAAHGTNAVLAADVGMAGRFGHEGDGDGDGPDYE